MTTSVFISEEGYLRLEELALDVKHEYYGGEMFCVSGCTCRHSLITTNVIALLYQALRGSRCHVYDSHLRVHTPGPFYAYPDLSVVRGAPQCAKKRDDTIENPTVLVEVLSPASESRDKILKLDQYRTLASLDTYLILAQSEPRAYVYRARPKGKWELEDIRGLKETVEIPAIKVKLAMRDLYDGAEF